MGAKSIKVILILIILGGCLRTPKHPNNYYFKHLSSGNSQLAQKDKRDISHSFIMNVEYLRCNPEVFEQINFYKPYSERFDTIHKKYIPSPIPTDQQLIVRTERIEYSKDSCFCFAILLIENHFSSLKGFEDARVLGRFYDSQAIIGYRKSKNDIFKIYPDDLFKATGFTDKNTPVEIVERDYSCKLKKFGSVAGSIYRDKTFNENVGDSLFFENSPFFQKYNDTTFNFQMYRWGEDYRHDYPY